MTLSSERRRLLMCIYINVCVHVRYKVYPINVSDKFKHLNNSFFFFIITNDLDLKLKI